MQVAEMTFQPLNYVGNTTHNGGIVVARITWSDRFNNSVIDPQNHIPPQGFLLAGEICKFIRIKVWPPSLKCRYSGVGGTT